MLFTLSFFFFDCINTLSKPQKGRVESTKQRNQTKPNLLLLFLFDRNYEITIVYC